MKHRLKGFFFLILLLIITVIALPGYSSSVAAAEQPKADASDAFDDDMSDFEEEDGDSGFDEVEDDLPVLNQSVADSAGSRVWQFGGFFREEVGYSFDREGAYPEFSKIRSVLNLSLDFKPGDNWQAKAVWNGFYDYAYSNHGRDEFTDETLDNYESESEIRDFFVDGAVFNWVRIKFGRQIIAWGESEVEQITDLVNPRDNRELGIVDLEDARIPVLATKVSLISGPWETNLVAVHENRANKVPSEGSEFDPLSGVRGTFNINNEAIPENSAENTEYLIRVFRSFNGGDIALVWAEVYSDSFHLDFESYNALSNQLSLTPRHKKVQVIGASGNMVRGSWLFKTEVARKSGAAIARNQADLTSQLVSVAAVAQSSGTTFYNRDTNAVETWSEKDLLQGMLGFEYSGLDDLTITLEGSLEKIEAYEDNLGSEETSGSTTFRVSYTALNDSFKTDFFWFHLTDDNGDVYRINLDYDLRDALNISGGLVLYEASETTAIVYPFRHNDRIFTSLKYSF